MATIWGRWDVALPIRGKDTANVHQNKTIVRQTQGTTTDKYNKTRSGTQSRSQSDTRLLGAEEAMAKHQSLCETPELLIFGHVLVNLWLWGHSLLFVTLCVN
eukprot:GHVO01070695.1.p2 GENE.GHVO01070695.1~~GHVO01070695.1.p2  ORF type:complete len:102 (-),score=6.92 GHVO01070695.1:66-371(-)